MKMMRVLNETGDIQEVPMEMLDEDHAIKIHSQSLGELNDRGGMSYQELVMNLEKKRYDELSNFTEKEIYAMLKGHLMAFKASGEFEFELQITTEPWGPEALEAVQEQEWYGKSAGEKSRGSKVRHRRIDPSLVRPKSGEPGDSKVWHPMDEYPKAIGYYRNYSESVLVGLFNRHVRGVYRIWRYSYELERWESTTGEAVDWLSDHMIKTFNIEWCYIPSNPKWETANGGG